MSGLIAACAAILALSVVMSMTGRGGGNVYVPALVACGLPMLRAATTGQCILVSTELAAALAFHKNRTIDWKLALVIDPLTDIMALVGGYCAHLVPGRHLTFKLVFAGLLVLAGFFMLRQAKDRPFASTRRLGFWRRKCGEHEYVVNL